MNTPYSTGCTQVCNQGRDCTCVTQHCQSAAPEGGNVRIAEPEPVRFNVFENVLIYCIFTTLLVISIGLLVMASDSFYQRFFN
jgi:cell division protein FtsL